MTIEANKNVTVEDGDLVIGTAGHGIDFSAQTGTSGATGVAVGSELLDHYERGTITGSFTPSGSGSIAMNGSFTTLGYVKIGDLVTVTGLLIVGSVSSPVGRVSIPLPFAAIDLLHRAGDASAAILVTGISAGNIADMISSVNEANSNLEIFLGDSTQIQSDSANVFISGTQVYLSCSYLAA